MHRLRGGPGYLIPLGGLLACLVGAWGSVKLGIPIRTAAVVGIPTLFAILLLGGIVWRVNQLRSVGEREQEIREYLRNQ